MLAYENLRREGKVKPFILREAWEQYKPVRFISPQSVKEMQLGITYVQRGDLDEAEQIFNKHLNDDASAAAYNNLGNISLRRGKFQEAENRYLKALKDDPGVRRDISQFRRRVRVRLLVEKQRDALSRDVE